MNPFTDREWETVRRAIRVRVRERFRFVTPEDLDDAVASAVMNLFVTWKFYPSTLAVEDPARLQRYAIIWGTWRAKQYLADELAVKRDLSYYDREAKDSDEPLWNSVPDRDPEPDEVYIRDERIRELKAAFGRMSEKRRHDLRFMASGTSLRQQARQEGVHPSSIDERRKRAVTELRQEMSA